MREFSVAFAGLALLLCPLVVLAAPPEATAYQITVDHAGVTSSGGALALQPTPLWKVSLPAAISYPLIAGGAVFVTVAKPNTTNGTTLYALNAATGATLWGPVDLGGNTLWSNATYDAGKLFVLNWDGTLSSFDATTGAPGWSASLGTYAFDAPPTASNGVIYVSGYGYVRAIDESNGSTKWSVAVVNGDISSPAVGPAGVYVGYACPNVYGIGLDGTLHWQYPNPMQCSGGGGKNIAYRIDTNRVFARDGAAGYVIDASNGSLVTSFNAGTIPAVTPTQEFFLYNSTLTAKDQKTGNQQWSFTGDGQLSSAPIVIDNSVIVGSGSGMLYAVNAATGTVNWQVQTGGAIYAPDEQNVSQPLTGLAAGDGVLVVPSGTTLIAYAILGPPAPASLSASGAAGAINLSWTAGAGAANYNVYMGTSSDTESITPVLTGVSGTSATVPVNVIPAQNYFFQVKAVSAAGISAPSNEAFASAHTPAPPAGLTATAGIGSVQLSWTASAEAQSYDIYSGTSATPLESGVTTTSAMFSGLTAGTPLYYTVRSVAYGTVGGPSNQVMVTPLPVPAPTNLKATAGNASVTLTWSAASGASSYSLYMGTSAGGEAAQPVQSGISNTTATVSGLSNGSAYYFVVRAAGAAGTSQASSEVAATPAAPPPPPASGGGGGGGGGGGWDWLSVALLASLAGLRARRSTRT
jgi:outer membrane protein assembly factor BamB